MSIYQAVFLAIVQGLTEFLPVSSSGHLVIFQKIFGFEEPPFFFDVLVHVGTLGAILVFFRDKIFALFKNKKFLLLLFLGTLPVCLLALILEGLISQIFNSLKLVGFSYLIMALILFSTRFLKKQAKEIKNLGWPDALFIGAFQALAILPGISRSGATISAGLWRGFEKDSAFDFSFFLGILAISGAFVFKIGKLTTLVSPNGLVNELLGMLVAGIVGYFSLKTLKNFIGKGRLYLFGFYCLAIGLLALYL